MDGPQEYEVESITRARVHDKKGKKITWKYYVKWKGYGWDESTWEPTDSFQGGSEHILESFWDRIDTSGRDIADASAFKKGEELLISGPPGRKSLKRKVNMAKTQTQVAPSSKDVLSPNGAAISAPPLPSRKRRRVDPSIDDGQVYRKPRRRTSTGVQKNGTSKRRRASSPGPRKSAPKRLPSAGDSQLDADGETDPDVVEVEDELMQVSVEDAEEDATKTRYPISASGMQSKFRKIEFDDLEHFYSGNPIDIDQNTDDPAAVRKRTAQPRPQSPSSAPDDTAPGSQVPASPTISAYDPLFDSPSRSTDKAPEIRRGSVLPPHRIRTAKPLVKLIDATKIESTSNQSRITAKARLMSLHTSGGDIAKRGGKPGPSRSSFGLITRSRSSLLTITKGALKSVKGNFTSAMGRDLPDEIEELPGSNESNKLHVTSWSDEDVDQDRHQATSNPQPGTGSLPSGDELLQLAGVKADSEPLPDYEDDPEPIVQPQDVKEMQILDVASTSAEEPTNQSSIPVVEEPNTSDNVQDGSSPVSDTGQQTSTPTTSNPSVPSVVAPTADEAVKKNIELAKEHLFPSTQMSFNTFSTSQSSFRSTIFGPLYQGSAANSVPVAKDEFSATFRIILGDGIELPLVLEDHSEIKARISDILIGNSSGGKVGLFYSTEDALAMVNTLKSDGTARVVLDPSAVAAQQECFSTLLQRFQSSHTLIAPVGSEVCVLYSSENADIAEKLGAPKCLRGLSGTLLVSHASIENQLAYVGAIMKATAL